MFANANEVTLISIVPKVPLVLLIHVMDEQLNVYDLTGNKHCRLQLDCLTISFSIWNSLFLFHCVWWCDGLVRVKF